ncbi:MAG: hypothetical protein KH436_08810 [Firmicutes bacterium]|nr:hypothetical protein [Bacillota bacterium]
MVGINSFELKEVARYDYDAWGNAMVTAVGDEKIDGISVAEFNPIRWKSQYYDTESGLYYINGRYYSPMTKQYLSGANVESTMLNATTIYSLCLYSFALTNPVNMGYNGYTSETNRPLVYDPPELNAWEKFWQSTLSRNSFGYDWIDGRFADNFCSDSRVSEQFKGKRILARVRAVYLRKMGAGSGDHGTAGNRQHRNQRHCGRYSQIRQYPSPSKFSD